MQDIPLRFYIAKEMGIIVHNLFCLILSLNNTRVKKTISYIKYTARWNKKKKKCKKKNNKKKKLKKASSLICGL